MRGRDKANATAAPASDGNAGRSSRASISIRRGRTSDLDDKARGHRSTVATNGIGQCAGRMGWGERHRGAQNPGCCLRIPTRLSLQSTLGHVCGKAKCCSCNNDFSWDGRSGPIRRRDRPKHSLQPSGGRGSIRFQVGCQRRAGREGLVRGGRRHTLTDREELIRASICQFLTMAERVKTLLQSDREPKATPRVASSV
jgi:hypothetical protein